MNISDIEHVYFCTGARNNDLLSFFSEEKTSFEIDERIASFKALGRTKISLKPIAVCTTSGSAVSECLSAMVEAYYSHLPLILISGDRPKRMHGHGCPQTIDHEILTRGIRQSYIELTIDEFSNLELDNITYPAHINILIEKSNESPIREAKEYPSCWTGLEQFIQDNPSPLILVSHENTSMLQLVEKLSQTGLPLYAEILSGAHTLSTIKYEKDIINAVQKGEITSLIRIGHTPLNKLWRLMEQKRLPVFSFDERGFKGLSYGQVLSYSSSELLKDETFWSILKKTHSRSLSGTPLGHLNSLMIKYSNSDISKIAQLEFALEDDAIVYLGNSLVIRFYELINHKKHVYYGNRGVNGIDGQISTAIGLALSTDKMVYGIVGDLTALYDLSAMRDLPQNLRIVIVNNSGGRIFQTMDLNPKLFLEHTKNFEAIASAFDLSYARNDFKQLKNVQIFELETNPEETMAFLKEWHR